MTRSFYDVIWGKFGPIEMGLQMQTNYLRENYLRSRSKLFSGKPTKIISTEIYVTPEIMDPKIFYIYMLIMALGGSEVI